jgi:steroid 5-alpha reductase family enzyme
MACSFYHGWITFYSPLITTLLLRYVSGVPILEKEFEKRPGFKEYAASTNCFLPWFPKDPPAAINKGKNEDPNAAGGGSRFHKY